MSVVTYFRWIIYHNDCQTVTDLAEIKEFFLKYTTNFEPTRNDSVLRGFWVWRG
jgi:hypothetical protein